MKRVVSSVLLGLFAAAGVVGVVEGCSPETLVLDGRKNSGGDDDDENKDSGSGGAPSIDRDASSTPRDSGTGNNATGTIPCGTTQCNAPTEACCSSSALDGGGICQAAAAGCPSGSTKVGCDEPSDCGSGQTCCVSSSGWACAASCGFGAYKACKTDTDCGTGGACKDYSCPQPKKVRTCTQPFLCN